MPVNGNALRNGTGSAYGHRNAGPVDGYLATIQSSDLYAISDNVFDINYTPPEPLTAYSETNHRVTFGNAQNTTSVARLIESYGYGNRAVEWECMVLAASASLGFRATLGQLPTTTSFNTGSTGDIVYRATTGDINVSGSTVATVATWTAGDKIGFIYRRALGTIEFFKNGASVYTLTGVSGDLTPAAMGSGGTTTSIRVSTAWSYPLPGDALYWR